MPPRTNPFQTLLYRIQTALAGTGAHVEESAEVYNFSSEKKDEIDVLITFEQSCIDFRVGIQCRDHSRKAGPAWIRDIKQQREDCRLQKMVAVHSKGFTGSAVKAAEKFAIDVSTLLEAEQSDWTKYAPQQFQFRIPPHIHKVELRPPITSTLKPQQNPTVEGTFVCKSHGKHCGTPQSWALNFLRTQVLENSEFIKILDTESKRLGGQVLCAVNLPTKNHLLCFEGKHHVIDEMIIHLHYVNDTSQVHWESHAISGKETTTIDELKTHVGGKEISMVHPTKAYLASWMANIFSLKKS